jgi:methyl-accepting chemotaxis protein
MWRNFKLSTKFMLGFGGLLFIFAVSVFIAWREINRVVVSNELLIKQVVPASLAGTEFECDAYEVFVAVKDMHYTGTDRSIAIVQDKVAKVKKSYDKIMALHNLYPDLKGPSHVAKVITPTYEAYLNILDRTFAGITKMNASFAILAKAGAEMTSRSIENQEYSYQKAKGNVAGVSPGKMKELLELWYDAEILVDSIAAMIQNLDTAMIHSNIEMMNKTPKTLSQIQDKVQTFLEKLDDPEQEPILSQLLSAAETYNDNLGNFISAYEELQTLLADRAPLMDTFNTESSNASAMSMNRVRSVSQASDDELNASVVILWTSTAIAIVLGVIIAFFIARGIARPLNTIVGLAKRAEGGDLTVVKKDFGYEGEDELGHLATALSNMVAAQERSMQEVVSVANKLTDGANNLSSLSEETNASMEEVKASIDQVSALSESNGAALEECNAGVEEMSAGADTVAQSAADSASFIAQTADTSNKAVETVNNVIRGMQNVDKNAKESESRTRELVESVKNVSSFVSVITGIADQTNLLALNAAIEAARAGDVGRGFAVVAEEVRKLAEESARAAQNVKGIITELQAGAQKSIEATMEAGRMLVETLTQAVEAQEDLHGALDQMNKASDSIQNIAAVAEEQAASSREVATGIGNATQSTMEMVNTVSGIRRATDDTATAAQGVAEHAESMSEHAHTLIEVLSRFKLHAGTAAAAKALKARTR